MPEDFFPEPEELKRKEADEYLNSNKKAFDSYVNFSREITAYKRSRRRISKKKN